MCSAALAVGGAQGGAALLQGLQARDVAEQQNEVAKTIAERELAGQTLEPALPIDAELPLEDLRPEVYLSLEGLAPFN